MPFLSSLQAQKVQEASSLGRARWKLTDDLVYESPLAGLVVVPAGFVSDFASVPRLPFIYLLTGDAAHSSAVVHDWLCHAWVVDRKGWAFAASVFREAMEAEGVPAWRRWAMYLAVRLANPFME